MSNAERQRKFRASHPGYYSRRRFKVPSKQAALAAMAAAMAAANAPAPAAEPIAPPPPAEPAAPQGEIHDRRLRLAA
jgi:hypothetical protein